MKCYELSFNGRTVKLPAEKVGGKLWFHLDGETYVYEPPRKNKGRAGQGSAEPGKIKSPMPGKIIKVLAQEGQTVTAGSAVIVMEAMKMEYTLTADLNGKIKTLNCSEGQQVTLGQLLAEIEEG